MRVHKTEFHSLPNVSQVSDASSELGGGRGTAYKEQIEMGWAAWEVSGLRGCPHSHWPCHEKPPLLPKLQ